MTIISWTACESSEAQSCVGWSINDAHINSEAQLILLWRAVSTLPSGLGVIPPPRLDGPGLIPVSFIEIRDMTTGKAVTDTQEAVQRAGVPKVEEWKKMAADDKNGSIPPPWETHCYLGFLHPDIKSPMQALQAQSVNMGSPSTIRWIF
jgi:hypothetical protein